MTTARYLEEWVHIQRTKVRYSTWRSREAHVRHYLIPRLGRVKLASLTPLMVERFLVDISTAPGPRGRVPAPRTVGHIRATLRRALSSAQVAGLVTSNAARFIDTPRIEASDLQPLSATEARRFLEATADRPARLP